MKTVAFKIWCILMLIMQTLALHYDITGEISKYLISRDMDIVLDIVVIIFWSYMVFGNGNNNKVNYD